METLIARPNRLNARLAVSRAGSEATQLGQAPHHLAERRRGLRRVAVIRHGLNRVPLPRCNEHFAGHIGSGAARHRDLVDPPRHKESARPGVQPPRIRLHASRLELTPGLEPPAKPCDLPPTLRPRQHQTSPREIRHGQTREQEPFKRLLVAGWSALRRIHGDDLNGGQRASWPAGARARHPFDGHAAGGLSRSPGGLTRQLNRDGARGSRLRPRLPEGTRGFPWAEPSIALGPDEALRPVLRCTPHRIQKPRLTLPCPLGHAHHERVRTALLDRTGPRIPWQPAVALLRGKGLAVALLRHRRLRPLPQRQPEHPPGLRSGVKATVGWSRDASRPLLCTVPIPCVGGVVPSCRNVVSCTNQTTACARIRASVACVCPESIACASRAGLSRNR
jgi:hypothetical protein